MCVHVSVCVFVCVKDDFHGMCTISDNSDQREGGIPGKQQVTILNQ